MVEIKPSLREVNCCESGRKLRVELSLVGLNLLCDGSAWDVMIESNCVAELYFSFIYYDCDCA